MLICISHMCVCKLEMLICILYAFHTVGRVRPQRRILTRPFAPLKGLTTFSQLYQNESKVHYTIFGFVGVWTVLDPMLVGVCPAPLGSALSRWGLPPSPMSPAFNTLSWVISDWYRMTAFNFILRQHLAMIASMHRVLVYCGHFNTCATCEVET